MKKTFIIEGKEYTFTACTAIAVSEGDTERQEAVFVECTEDWGEVVQWVVFGWILSWLEDEKDLNDMSNDQWAWSTDPDNLKTVREI